MTDVGDHTLKHFHISSAPSHYSVPIGRLAPEWTELGGTWVAVVMDVDTFCKLHFITSFLWLLSLSSPSPPIPLCTLNSCSLSNTGCQNVICLGYFLLINDYLVIGGLRRMTMVQRKWSNSSPWSLTSASCWTSTTSTTAGSPCQSLRRSVCDRHLGIV